MCKNGGCAVGHCSPGFGDCNLDPTDGCESDVSSDHANCGSCGHGCAANEQCIDGVCATGCVPPLTDCGGGVCANIASSVHNCGACGKVCPSGPCVNGQCTVVPDICGPGPCNGCFDTTLDPQNCGSCGMSCGYTFPGFMTCVGSSCEACPAGFDPIKDSATTYECVNTMQDQSYCGPAHAQCNELCVNGACAPLAPYQIANVGTNVTHFVVDSGAIYYADDVGGVIGTFPSGGGASTTLATGQAKPVMVGVDATDVYWAANFGGAIMKVSKAGGAASVAAIASQPTELVVGATDIYWISATDSTLYATPKAGGANVPIYTSATASLHSLAQNTNELVFVDNVGVDQVFHYSKTMGGQAIGQEKCNFFVGTIYAIAVDDSQIALGCHGNRVLTTSWGLYDPIATRYAYQQGMPNLVLDSSGLYFSTLGGIAKINCSPVRMAGIVSSFWGALPLATDAQYLYMATGGTFLRFPK